MTTTVERLGGEDRYETAALVATRRHTGGNVATVWLAVGEGPDSGTVNAGDDPVLYTRTDHLPAVTAQALKDLDPDEVVVVGGTGAVSDTVLQEVEALFAS